jgi:hypothetical protein
MPDDRVMSWKGHCETTRQDNTKEDVSKERELEKELWPSLKR